MVNLYSKKEIEKLAESGKILSEVLREVSGHARAGISTYELDRMAEKNIRAAGGQPAFLGYKSEGSKPYPASLCTSINDELVHCIPYKDRFLKAGDIIGLDLGVRYKGFVTDMAVTVAVGEVSDVAGKLMKATAAGLDEAVRIAKPGITLGDLGHAIQGYAEASGFSVIRDLVGHGVGHEVHEDPQIPNFGVPGKGLKLASGMVLAIEPMFAQFGHKIKMCPDGWGIKTSDGGLTAHFEKTIAITEDGCLVLTP